MELYERLIKYVKIDTKSDPESETTPSTAIQFDLGKLLKEELIEIGLKDVILDEYGYVYGTIPANIDRKVPTVGFIAHMDTSFDFSGSDVKPRIIYDYDGKDIQLNEERVIKVNEFPQFKKYVGNNIMVTDGTTLLGADDKAGIAAIVQACKYIINHPEVQHGDIKVGFSVDEEIGRGADHFNIPLFNCDFAYTLDGDEVSCLEIENFNAASAVVEIKGKSIHPGSAKNKMVNAINLAMEFHGFLPVSARPEHTEGREGFNHITHMEGSCEQAKLSYIIRNHNLDEYHKQIELFYGIAELMNKKFNEERVKVVIKESYKNMYEILKDKPEIIKFAEDALLDMGITPTIKSIRGGTDGSKLTYEGLPCPNLGTGGGNFHGPYEYCNLTQLEQAVELIINIVKKVGENK